MQGVCNECTEIYSSVYMCVHVTAVVFLLGVILTKNYIYLRISSL